jgi:E3 ubiquitin-protein ligase TRIP12
MAHYIHCCSQCYCCSHHHHYCYNLFIHCFLSQVLRDGSLPLCVPERVHDVKLGDPAEDANPASSANNSQSQPPVPSGSIARNTMSRPDPADLRAMSSMFGSRGAMSFAAAAMAGLASVSGRGIRGSSRDRRGLGLGGISSEHHNRLMFTAGGRQLSKNMTIYQAIQRQLVHDEEDEERFGGSDLPNDGSRFWSDIFTITYQKSDGSASQGGPGSASSAAKSKSGSSRAGSDGRCHQVSLFDSLLQGELPCDMERSNPTYNILALLRMLDGLNQLAPRLRIQAVSDDFAEGQIDTLDELYRTSRRVPNEDFVNNKLTPKLSRQIQDVLALCSGSLPAWCYQLTKSCPFLFPFETRRQYFYSTAFGLSRALHRLQQQQGADNTNSSSEREVRVGRLQRQKVRVSRNRILDSAAKVMEMFSSQKVVLEVEYFGEVGTGLGPTLEFYTLLSHDLQKAGLGLWRSSSDIDDSSVMETDIGSDGKKPGVDLTGKKDDLVHAPLGLFPRPWPVNANMSEGSQFYKVVEHFRLIGRVMAKALQDGRLLDLPVSTAFYKLVLGQVSVVVLLHLFFFF